MREGSRLRQVRCHFSCSLNVCHVQLSALDRLFVQVATDQFAQSLQHLLLVEQIARLLVGIRRPVSVWKNFFYICTSSSGPPDSLAAQCEANQQHQHPTDTHREAPEVRLLRLVVPETDFCEHLLVVVSVSLCLCQMFPGLFHLCCQASTPPCGTHPLSSLVDSRCRSSERNTIRKWRASEAGSLRSAVIAGYFPQHTSPQYPGSRTQSALPSCPIERQQDVTCFLQLLVEIRRFPLRSRSRITIVHQPISMCVRSFVRLSENVPTPISLISSRPESSTQVPPHK